MGPVVSKCDRNPNGKKLGDELVALLPDNYFKNVLRTKVSTLLRPQKDGRVDQRLSDYRLATLLEVLRGFSDVRYLRIDECIRDVREKVEWVGLSLPNGQHYYCSISALFWEIYIRMHVEERNARKTLEGLIDKLKTENSVEEWIAIERECKNSLEGIFKLYFVEILQNELSFCDNQPFHPAMIRKLHSLKNFTKHVEDVVKEFGSVELGKVALEDILQCYMDCPHEPGYRREMAIYMEFVKHYSDVCKGCSESELLEMAGWRAYKKVYGSPTVSELLAFAVKRGILLSPLGIPINQPKMERYDDSHLPLRILAQVFEKIVNERRITIDWKSLLRWITYRIIFNKDTLVSRFKALERVSAKYSKGTSMIELRENDPMPRHAHCRTYCGKGDRTVKCPHRFVTEKDLIEEIIPTFFKGSATYRSVSCTALHLLKHGGGPNRMELYRGDNLEKHCREYFENGRVQDLAGHFYRNSNRSKNRDLKTLTYSLPLSSQFITAKMGYWDKKRRAVMAHLAIQPDSYVYCKSVVLEAPTKRQQRHFQWKSSGLG